MRNMSFAMTTTQMRRHAKTVTRRFGWWFLRPGDLVQPVEKAMGLKKGEKIKKICCPIRVVSTQREPLNAVTKHECFLEGFPEMFALEFADMIMRHYGCSFNAIVNRIQFEFTEAL